MIHKYNSFIQPVYSINSGLCAIIDRVPETQHYFQHKTLNENDLVLGSYFVALNALEEQF